MEVWVVYRRVAGISTDEMDQYLLQIYIPMYQDRQTIKKNHYLSSSLVDAVADDNTNPRNPKNLQNQKLPPINTSIQQGSCKLI